MWVESIQPPKGAYHLSLPAIYPALDLKWSQHGKYDHQRLSLLIIPSSHLMRVLYYNKYIYIYIVFQIHISYCVQ